MGARPELPLKTLPRLLPALRALSPADLGSLALWAVTIAALEVWGREAKSDVGDALGLFTLAGLLSATTLGYRTGRLRWVAFAPRIGVRAQAVWRARVPEIGIDLRREPPVPGATPPLARGALLLVGAALLVSLPVHGRFPHALRDVVAPLSYVVYLLLLGSLWTLLATGGLFSILPAFFWVHDRFVERRERRRPTGQSRAGARLEPVVHLTFAALYALAVVAAPSWLALALVLGAGLVALAVHLRPLDPPLVLLWRRRDGGEVRAFGWRRSMTTQILVTVGIVLLLTIWSRGDRLLGPPPDVGSLQLTPVLGRLFEWAACMGLGVLTAQALRAQRAARRFRAATRALPAIHLGGVAGSAATREVLRERLAAAGWRAAFDGEERAPDALRLVLVDEEPDPFEEFYRQGPRRATLAALEDPARRATLVRARDIHLRRRLTKGLRAALVRARRRRYARGNGFWVAPQYWFVTGLSRDEVEEGPNGGGDYLFEQILGAPWEQTIPWASRAWFYEVCRDLEVDLIFLEDGLGWKRLRSVLDVLFEVHDVHGGRERLEERHLSSLVGVRGVLHEVELGNPFRAKGYPEPDYEDLARARVLHVFKDRGGEDESADAPTGVEDRPVLVPSF